MVTMWRGMCLEAEMKDTSVVEDNCSTYRG